MIKINVQSIHFSADSKLIAFIEKKLSRLSRYFEQNIEADVHLKLQDTGSKVQEKVTEIRLNIPGGWLIDKKTDRSFEAALTSSVDTLKRQLTRHKERAVQHPRTRM